LPAVLALLPSSEGNFRLYKATAVHLWAQTQFGTFRAERRMDPDSPEGIHIELTLDDRPMQLPEPTREPLPSIVLDSGDIPGEYDPNLYEDRGKDPDQVWQGPTTKKARFYTTSGTGAVGTTARAGGHPSGVVRSAPRRGASLLHHHRRARPGVFAPHVRRSRLWCDQRGGAGGRSKYPTFTGI